MQFIGSLQHLLTEWSCVDTAFDSHAFNSAFAKFLSHVSHGHPLNAFVAVDVLDHPARDSQQISRDRLRREEKGYLPFVHQYDLRLPANLRMDTNWKDKRIILAIRKVKLFAPKLFDNMCIDEAMLRGCISPCVAHDRAADLTYCWPTHHGLQWRPVVKMPVGWDLHDFARLQSSHGCHPIVCVFLEIRLDP